MIKRLCPKGVESVKLGNYIILYTGEQLNKANMFKMGSYPVINGGVSASGFVEAYNEQANTITISQGGASAGYVNFIKVPFWAGAHCFVIKPNSDNLNKRFLYHYIKGQEFFIQQCQQGAGIPSVNSDKIKKLLIPLSSSLHSAGDCFCVGFFYHAHRQDEEGGGNEEETNGVL